MPLCVSPAYVQLVALSAFRSVLHMHVERVQPVVVPLKVVHQDVVSEKTASSATFSNYIIIGHHS